MPFVAVVGTPLIGPGAGVIGTPPLIPIPGRPKINGIDVAMVNDLVQFTYSDTRGTQILTISQLNASIATKVNGISVAMQGTAMSDASVTIGVPPQTLVQTV